MATNVVYYIFVSTCPSQASWCHLELELDMAVKDSRSYNSTDAVLALKHRLYLSMVYTEADIFKEAATDRKRLLKWDARKYKEVFMWQQI